MWRVSREEGFICIYRCVCQRIWWVFLFMLNVLSHCICLYLLYCLHGGWWSCVSFFIACMYICLNCTYWCTEYVIFYFYSILLIMNLFCVRLRTCNYTATRHFIRYTSLLPDSTLFTFSTTLILISSTDSTRCWQHSSDFGHTDMRASHRQAANP